MPFLSEFFSQQFATLPLWQWAVLGAIPPAIFALYFLKLRREPLEVPSTYLWAKTIEDLHVNSLWQRLRKSLLLLLQILFVLLAMIALLRPSWNGSKLTGDRFIFLVDTSASMNANDVPPTRLAEAKRRVAELVEQMKSGDEAMILSFSDTARVEQLFTDNHRELLRRLDAIVPTHRTTSLGEALRVAAGLANKSRTTGNASDNTNADKAVGATSADGTAGVDGAPATLYIFSDGKFPDIENFSLGSLKPVFVPIGATEPSNVGITAFSTRRPEGQLDKLEAFGRLENTASQAVTVQASLELDGTLIDAKEVKIPARSTAGLVFALDDVHEGVLKLYVDNGGALPDDDVAVAAINAPRRAKVLYVSPGDDALDLALGTQSAAALADVIVAKPALLETPDYQRAAASGAYDLVIYDQCAPREMPQANTLFIGRLPPVTWSAADKVTGPQILDVRNTHPLAQLIDLGNVSFAEAAPLKPPPGAMVLIESTAGPLLAIAPREAFEDAVLAPELVGVNEKGEKYANTDWPLRLSFPIFVLNVLSYFGGGEDATSGGSLLPGRTITLRGEGAFDSIDVKTPAGKNISLRRGKLPNVNFGETDELGIYEVREKNRLTRRFAVNLFDSTETDIRPRPENSIKIGYVDVAGQTAWEGVRREAWKPLLLVALALLLGEWYIYNRRVYL